MHEHIIRGRYKLIRQLNRGVFGEVSEAENILDRNKRCVIEQFQPKSTDPDSLKRARNSFYKQVDALTKLGKRSQIPSILDHFEENQTFYLVRELIDGAELTQEIIPEQPLTELKTILILKDILRVLAVVHQKHRVIHQNIKPASLIRRRKDQKIVLANFGLVNPQEQNCFVVSPQIEKYVPPEQSHNNPTFSSDIYALGIIGIQACTGLSLDQLTRNDGGEILIPLKTPISPELAEMLDKMVCLDHEKRYSSAMEALAAIKNLPKRNIQLWVGTWTKDELIAFGGLLVAIITGIAAWLSVPLISEMLKTRLTPVAQTPSPTVPVPGPSPLPSTATMPDNFKLLEDDRSQIQIGYPVSWSAKKLPVLPIDKKAIAKFQFLPSKQSDPQFSLEQVILRIEDWSNEAITLSQYTEMYSNEIKRDSLNYSSKQSLLSDLPAYKAFITKVDEQSGQRTSNLAVWTAHNNRIYVITYTAEPDKYNQSLDSVEKMISSFRITDRS